MTMTFGGKSFSWSFLLAAVDFPILGADFLSHFGLIVDLQKGTVLEASTLKIFPIAPADSEAPAPHGLFAAVASAAPKYRALLGRFQDVACSSKVLPSAKHGVLHHIETVGRPCFSHFRRLDPAKLADAKAEFAEMEKQGIVRRSNSPWASPLHMVLKKDGSWRPCGDYRLLNLATEADKYPLPNMADVSFGLHGKKIFSKIDLRKGYWQIPVNPADIPKTAVITPFGLFEFLRMPFGLKNAGMTFQRLMDHVFANMPFVFVYLDDILIASRTDEEHVEHVALVLEQLRKFGLVINADKCEFGVSTVEFLGHVISEHGATPQVRHVEAIVSFKAPSDQKGLMRFLGLLNFYRKFIANAALILLPLTEALKGGPRAPWVWTEDMQQSFMAAKAALLRVVALVHPVPNAELCLAVDASDSHVGAVLHQCSGNMPSWQPLGFFSQKLNSAEKGYAAFDRELLAIKKGIEHFRFMLEGNKFFVETDHKPLTYALKKVSDPLNARQARHLSYIAEFTADIRHVPGVQNVVADCLSRPATIASLTIGQLVSNPPDYSVPPPLTYSQACRQSRHVQPARLVDSSSGVATPALAIMAREKVSSAVPLTVLPPLTFAQVCQQPLVAQPSLLVANLDVADTLDLASLAKNQQTCPAVQALQASKVLKVKLVRVGQIDMLCDVSHGRVRPLVPNGHRRLVFHSLHGIAHAGSRATRRLISARFVWKGMHPFINQMVRDCQRCSVAKIVTHAKAPVVPMPIPAMRFLHVHVDLVGPLPISKEGFTHLFTMVDRTSRWAEAIPLSNTSAQHCAEALFSGWIARFGVPSAITSDRGSQFTSAIWRLVCVRLGIKHISTTAFHPQSNGMVERFHRSLKDALRARCSGLDWPSHLPWVLLGLRAAPKEDSGISSAQVVYGSPLVLPGELHDMQLSWHDHALEQGHGVVHDSFMANLGTALRDNIVPMLTRPLSDAQKADSVPAALRGADYVYVRRDGHVPALGDLYVGPYHVLHRGPKAFRLRVGLREEVISVDRLKACLAVNPIPGVPAARGRPRRT
jgi:transposase InsO family protein